MKHKTSELTGNLLNQAVAKAEGRDVSQWGMIPRDAFYADLWALGGPIIEREGIALQPMQLRHPMNPATWVAHLRGVGRTDVQPQGHAEPLVAAMRVHVVSTLGEVIELP